EIVKGYEFEKGEYVVLTDDDFKKVNPEATQSVDILEFVELDKINPMYFDKPYYLEPTKQGRHAYALLRETLTQCNRVAIARVVVRTKEYIAAVKAIDDALVLELMHWASEIVAPDTLEIPDREKLPEKEMKMARMLVDTMSVEEFEPEKFTNKYRDELMTMIDARAAGKELPEPKKAPARSKVVNLMDVLAQSLEESKKRRTGTNGKASTTKRRKTTAA
ncbi:MAG TPA: Ku protein, partial [Candidatus Cybelea sp.]|nr:Ku protein [Candidatus Cybelea sp.]